MLICSGKGEMTAGPLPVFFFRLVFEKKNNNNNTELVGIKILSEYHQKETHHVLINCVPFT